MIVLKSTKHGGIKYREKKHEVESQFCTSYCRVGPSRDEGLPFGLSIDIDGRMYSFRFGLNEAESLANFADYIKEEKCLTKKNSGKLSKTQKKRSGKA